MDSSSERRLRTASLMNCCELSHLEESLYAFVDSDWAGDHDTSRSVSTGQVFMMNRGPVSWRSKQQKIVATSTTCHAEYVAACEACRECVWIRELMNEIGFTLKKPTEIYEDNESTLFLSNNPVSSDRSKHFRLRWHYLRQCVRDGS